MSSNQKKTHLLLDVCSLAASCSPTFTTQLALTKQQPPQHPTCFWMSVAWLSRSRSASGVLLRAGQGATGSHSAAGTRAESSRQAFGTQLLDARLGRHAAVQAATPAVRKHAASYAAA